MEHAARRSIRAVAALTTTGALALTPITVAPPEVHAPAISPVAISTQAVQLTDAWLDLPTDTFASVNQLAKMFLGSDPNFPHLPSPTIALAPIATQLVLNQLIYLGQVFRGQGSQIPTEIADHFAAVRKQIANLAVDVPSIITQQLKTPFLAAQLAVDSISTSSNVLIGLIEAPAVFLDDVINNTYGLLGSYGPIGFPIIVRNLLAQAIDPPLPGWLSHILQPAKVPTAAATPVTLKPAATSSKAASARSGSKAPASSRKAASAKANSTGGAGHSKRG
jgi:hypothetical protein